MFYTSPSPQRFFTTQNFPQTQGRKNPLNLNSIIQLHTPSKADNSYRVHDRGTHEVISANSRANALGTEELLWKETKPKDRVLIISGTHGDQTGKTSAERPELKERQFC